jgi:arylsulfatase A
MPAQVYGDDLFSDFLIEFMKQHRDSPFFAYYPMALVHAPHIAPPGSARAGAAQKAAARGKRPGGKKKKNAVPGDDDEIINDPANFPDMVAYMDKTVGKLIAALEESGLRENTLVIFTGDNGTDKKITSKMGNVSIPGGKGTVTELGSHVPLIASWPGKIPAGRVSSDLINFCDVHPTLAEIGGAQMPAGVKIDGQSFAPRLTGQSGKSRDWVFTQLGHKRFARDDRYLLHDDGRLFEIPSDLFEKSNLSSSDKPEIIAAKSRLKAVLEVCK